MQSTNKTPDKASAKASAKAHAKSPAKAQNKAHAKSPAKAQNKAHDKATAKTAPAVASESGAFLPVNRKDMQARGWEEIDFLFLSGDAYEIGRASCRETV